MQTAGNKRVLSVYLFIHQELKDGEKSSQGTFRFANKW